MLPTVMLAKPAVIAVFGSHDKVGIEIAVKLGAAIACRKHVLLTGGLGPDKAAVKSSAIHGALEMDRDARWVGVDPKGAAIEAVPNGCGLIVRTMRSNERNYLEAHMCDAAIGIFGGAGGTVSEIIFSLALRRPVALLGSWKDLTPPSVGSYVDESFIRMAKDPVPDAREPGHSILGGLVTKIGIRGLLAPVPEHKHFPSSEPSPILDWIEETLGDDKRPGAFPDLTGYLGGYDRVRADYDAWLTNYRNSRSSHPKGGP